MEQVTSVVKKKDWMHYTIKSLAFWVVFAIIAGIVFGMVDPKMAVLAKPGIDWFIQSSNGLLVRLSF